MSVIAWDGKIVAADRMANDGEIGYLSEKLVRIKHKGRFIVIGTVGMVATGESMMHWYLRGAKETDWPKHVDRESKLDDGTAMVVFDGKSVLEYSHRPFPEKIIQSPHAWGNGRGVALGAMLAGLNAIEAVEICNLRVKGCGMGATRFILAMK